ncbi:MAG: type II toxin-antitoxin system HipA family toxin [Bacteroidetes bacterium]|nr:MAG: type II toxin-antitoxin system HipA family toxin [Bacteroidota bacterium]MBL1145327.1 type II toxin-antitoxin system HipA family toxin [Bacteroidota bacterium]NOG58124.1 type II toxin-antitoxin system HipA family toxin [Bacteroidota bacterium]
MNLLEVILWENLVGVLVWNEKKGRTEFEYAPAFIHKGIELSPIVNPTSKKIITAIHKLEYSSERSLSFDTNKGLPLFISDSLPDQFGTEIFLKYLEKEGKNYRDLNPLEKLAYIGNRGMGALEFKPAKKVQNSIELLNLKKLNELSISLLKNEPIANMDDMANLFHIGTSPGGAQPKVLINIDNKTGDIYRGDSLPTSNQDSWILKFNRDIGLESDKERGKIEYAYYLMARESKIAIMDSELKEFENDYYFMTKRFDRIDGHKLHTQTLHAFAGMNFKLPNTYSYEQIFTLLNKMRLNYSSKEQLFKVMIFNVIGRNVDDHTKNFGFNMNKIGEWSLSPAYDLTFSYNENFNRITPHFLSINGKNMDINLNDILHIAEEYSIKNPKKIINEVNQSFLNWRRIAEELNISKETTDFIANKLKTIPYKVK